MQIVAQHNAAYVIFWLHYILCLFRSAQWSKSWIYEQHLCYCDIWSTGTQYFYCTCSGLLHVLFNFSYLVEFNNNLMWDATLQEEYMQFVCPWVLGRHCKSMKGWQRGLCLSRLSTTHLTNFTSFTHPQTRTLGCIGFEKDSWKPCLENRLFFL